MRTPDPRRRILPIGLTGLTGAACAACCVIPVLLATGVLAGAGWVTAGLLLPGVTIGLAAAAAGTWWWARHRTRRAGCGHDDCRCAGHHQPPGPPPSQVESAEPEGRLESDQPAAVAP